MTLDRLRLALHLNIAGPLAESVALAQRAEDAGVDAIYVIEGLREPFVALAAMATATSSIGLGTYVANAYARTPQATATAALNLHDLSGGRFTLGIGTGNKHINEWLFGLDSRRPVQPMRDYLAILSAFLRGDTPAGPELGGEHHHMQSRFVPRAAERVPVVLAAAGPRMVELAATMTDGVGLGILISPEHLRDDIRPRAAAAAEAAGRDATTLRFPMAAMVSIDEDADVARTRTRQAICGLFHPIPHPYYDYLLRAQGYAAVADAATEFAPQKRWQEAADTITDELIDTLTITGTPQQCADRLRAYEGIADEVLCLNVGAPSSSDLVLRALALASA